MEIGHCRPNLLQPQDFTAGGPRTTMPLILSSPWQVCEVLVMTPDMFDQRAQSLLSGPAFSPDCGGGGNGSSSVAEPTSVTVAFKACRQALVRAGAAGSQAEKWQLFTRSIRTSSDGNQCLLLS